MRSPCSSRRRRRVITAAGCKACPIARVARSAMQAAITAAAASTTRTCRQTCRTTAPWSGVVTTAPASRRLSVSTRRTGWLGPKAWRWSASNQMGAGAPAVSSPLHCVWVASPSQVSATQFPGLITRRVCELRQSGKAYLARRPALPRQVSSRHASCWASRTTRSAEAVASSRMPWCTSAVTQVAAPARHRSTIAATRRISPTSRPIAQPLLPSGQEARIGGALARGRSERRANCPRAVRDNARRRQGGAR